MFSRYHNFAQIRLLLVLAISSITPFLFIPMPGGMDELVAGVNMVQDDRVVPFGVAGNDNNPSMTVDYHVNKFNHTPSWCPTADCGGTDLCYPCQRRWLVVVTPGRSASTTLLYMLDHLPNLRMAGENGNAIGKFKDFQTDVMESMKLRPQSLAWKHNRIYPEMWSCVGQNFFESIIPPAIREEDGRRFHSDEETILGFKTIRLFLKEDLSDVTALAATKAKLVQKLFPCARYIVNTRSDMDGRQKSVKRTFGKSLDLEQIQKEHDAHVEFHRILGNDKAFFLDSTQWATNISMLNHMVDWLGYSKECHFTEVLQLHTKGGYRSQKEAALVVDPLCRFLG